VTELQQTQNYFSAKSVELPTYLRTATRHKLVPVPTTSIPTNRLTHSDPSQSYSLMPASDCDINNFKVDSFNGKV